MRYKKQILYSEGGEALAKVARRVCGCPVPGSVQGQAGWDFEQPGLVAPMAGGFFARPEV